MASWIIPTLLSAFFLGIYDVCKKHAVRENSVMPVLFFSTLAGSLCFIAISAVRGNISSLQWGNHVLILVALKSILVATSWALVYYGMRELPISIAAPLRSSSPMWSVIGAIIIFGEMPHGLQWLGMVIIFGGTLAFAMIGKKENFSWHSKGFIFIFTATLLGAASAIYDKFLLATEKIPPATLQFHFSWMLVAVIGIALLIRVLFFKPSGKFHWRWSIPATGILLIITDLLYFYALSLPDAQISILSPLRRSSVIAAFIIGGGLFHEKLLLPKAAALAIILIGVVLLTLCS